LTGLKPEHVTSLKRSEVDTWNVTVELLELRRVPDTDDLIGSYEAELDDTGELLAYQRACRYSRCQPQVGPRDRNLDGDTYWNSDVEH
jgi:hypothetical protein